MQKWCPEPLAVEAGAGGTFVPLQQDDGGARTATGDVAGFRPEAGFADAEGLLNALSRQERAQIIELIESDLRREFEERHARDQEARDQALAQFQAEAEQARQLWHDEFSSALRQEIEDSLATVARRTVEMAVIIAEKIVRREVAIDSDVLVKALETVLYKVEAGSSLQVTVHPEDAEWLRSRPEICKRLRIADIKEDRRLDLGGALVKADDQEWDATIERQLAVLAETLDDALAIPPDTEIDEEAPDA
ncbi:hypothetical protein GF314_07520 [bacterium]|nr:hypothetical protein [bacterium]